MKDKTFTNILRLIMALQILFIAYNALKLNWFGILMFIQSLLFTLCVYNMCQIIFTYKNICKDQGRVIKTLMDTLNEYVEENDKLKKKSGGK